MSLTPTKPEGGNDRQLPPAGTHRAVLYKLINLGTLTTEYKGQKKKQHKIRLFWELSDKMVEYEKDGEKIKAPFSVGGKFTFSLGDQSHLYPIVTGMIGQGLTEDERWNFDIESLLGMSCLVSVVHDKTQDGISFAKIASTSPLIEGMDAPTQVNPTTILDVRKLTKEEIDELREYIKNDMMSSSEYHLRFLAPREDIKTGAAKVYEEQEVSDDEITEDDIPF